MEKSLETPAGIVALGLFFALVLWGLAQALPAFGVGIGNAVGLTIAISVTGVAAATSVATWIPTAAALGIAAGSGAVGLYVTVKIVKIARERPFDFALPFITLLSVFFVDITKEAYFEPSKIEQALFAAVTALATLTGGFLLTNQNIFVRIIGGGIPFLPPMLVLTLAMLSTGDNTLLSDLIHLSTPGAFGLVGMLAIGPLTVILWVLTRAHSQK